MESVGKADFARGRPATGAPLYAILIQHRWFFLVAAVLAGFAAWQGLRAWLGPSVVVDRVQRGELIESIVASGNVQTPFRVDIGAQITGTVEEVLVEEGQTVAKGQPLVALESQELKASVVQAEGAVAQAEARMRQLKELTLPSAREALTQAQATLLDAQHTFDRTASLAEKGYATRAALDGAQKNLDVAKTQARSADLQVFTASPGGSDYVMAETQLNQARASLDTAKSRLGYATIAAPRDGVLITRNVERGTVAQPGKPLLVLAPAGMTQLVLRVDERNLSQLKLGEKAVASADAYPNQKFAAVVSYINPGVDIARATVEAKLDVVDPPAYLRQDMTVSVDIEVARSNDSLVLPTRSVRDLLSGQPWVMSVRDGRAYRQNVTVGLRGATSVEIKDGLPEGALAIPTASGVLTGQRLRPVQP